MHVFIYLELILVRTEYMGSCQAEIDKDNPTNWNSGKGRVARHDLLKVK